MSLDAKISFGNMFKFVDELAKKNIAEAKIFMDVLSSVALFGLDRQTITLLKMLSHETSLQLCCSFFEDRFNYMSKTSVSIVSFMREMRAFYETDPNSLRAWSDICVDYIVPYLADQPSPDWMAIHRVAINHEGEIQFKPWYKNYHAWFTQNWNEEPRKRFNTAISDESPAKKSKIEV